MVEDLKTKKILIIEDDEFLSGLIVNRLKKQGFDAHLAMSAEEGLTKTEEIMPSLILLDIILPGMDGFEFLRTIKANQKLASIPVVILSNLGQKDEVEGGMKMGAIDFLIKSQLDMDEISTKVTNILSKMNQ